MGHPEEQRELAAPPRLYGAPAYARPPTLVAEAPRPFDPDDLPITALQTDEEREWIEALPPRAYAPGGGVVITAVDDRPTTPEPRLEPRPFFLRSLAGRILGSE